MDGERVLELLRLPDRDSRVTASSTPRPSRFVWPNSFGCGSWKWIKGALRELVIRRGLRADDVRPSVRLRVDIAGLDAWPCDEAEGMSGMLEG